MKNLLLFLFLVQVSCTTDRLQRLCPATCWPNNLEGPTAGECLAGTPVCDQDGNLIECKGYRYPEPEICDGLDNNCDSYIDYQLSRECSTKCNTGIEYCSIGEWKDCTAIQPSEEVCDGLDNDCDGQVDEDVFVGWTPSQRVCYSGPAGSEEFPPCDYGMLNCFQGDIVCTGEITPWIESCDGIDNNCNGLTDEGFGISPPPDPAPTFGVTPEINPEILAQIILGPGVEIVAGSASYSGGEASSGIFTGGLSAGLGLEEGIILTTGSVVNALPPNTNDNSSTSHSGLGDPDLDILVALDTNDAAVLEFDFRIEGDLYFRYIFASEEYNEYTNRQYNDVFAFFLDGINIAQIPGTNLPVAINTINGGSPLGINASHPELFNNNDPSDGGPSYGIEYDGFTHVLTAVEFGMGVGIHHIKLAIADRSDWAFDSAVFLEAKSFSTCVPED